MEDQASSRLLHVLFIFTCCLTAVWCADTRCTDRFGTCKYTSGGCSGGNFERGMCDGPYNRQCCVPDYTYADRQCTGRGGTCQKSTTSCSGTYERGICGGPWNRRCCLPPATSRPSGGSSGAACSRVTIVSRSEWGAKAPKFTKPFSSPVGIVFIHHTTGRQCDTESSCKQQVRNIQHGHMVVDHDWPDIGYNFLVGDDGRVYEGTGWDRWGTYHVKNFNHRSIGISFMGNFMNKLPSTAALNAAKDLIECGVSLGKLSSSYKLYGHRQAKNANKPCPGDTLYNEVKTWPHYTYSSDNGVAK